MKSDISTAKEHLIKFKQRLIYGMDIVYPMGYEIFYDNVEFVASGERITGLFQKLVCCLKIKLQCDGKGQSGALAGLIVNIASDL